MVTVNSELKDSLAVFRKGDGTAVRANLLRFTRHLAVAEIYDSAGSFLRTSEVLTEFKIILNDRTLYSGRAVVQDVINTGLVTICEATLDDAWIEVDAIADTPADMPRRFGEFVEQWQKLYRVMPEYKVVLADMQTFLTDARLWLEQVELGIRSLPSGDRLERERRVARELEGCVVPTVNSLFERFEAITAQVEEGLMPAHLAFAKRQLHPLLLCSPFVYRAFQKPLGYAGDYEMVNMMFRDPYEGASLFGKMVNAYALQLPPIIAHRNRIEYLVERLLEETLRAARQNRVARVYNLGCGPAHEVQRFLTLHSASDMAYLTLVDFNEETLSHTTGKLTELKHRNGRKAQLHLLKKSVQQLLKEEGDRGVRLRTDELYDFVYCAGLFDYLSDRVCRKLMEVLYDMVAPGGLLVGTNVDVHPARGEMECFLEWHLVHRNTQQMLTLAPGTARPEDVVVKREPTGVNLLMEVRKPAP